jgi:hypothetical protein
VSKIVMSGARRKACSGVKCKDSSKTFEDIDVSRIKEVRGKHKAAPKEEGAFGVGNDETESAAMCVLTSV